MLFARFSHLPVGMPLPGVEVDMDQKDGYGADEAQSKRLQSQSEHTFLR